MKYYKELSENMKYDDIVKSNMKLLQHCPEDFWQLRIEVVNRLKYIVSCHNQQNKLKEDIIN